MYPKKIDVVVLTGRPGAGKSEIIAFLKSLDTQRRLELGLGDIQEIDDFPYVWESFEIDDILERHGHARAFTDSDYYFKNATMMWTLFIERINLEFKKRVARDPRYLKSNTVFIEFARGGENGLRDAFNSLDPEILKRAAVLYLNVSYEESLRKNRLRARPGQEDSILYHSLPDSKLQYYYKVNDWDKLADAKEGLLSIRGLKIPYAVFDNEDDQTSNLTLLRPALEDALSRLRSQL